MRFKHGDIVRLKPRAVEPEFLSVFKFSVVCSDATRTEARAISHDPVTVPAGKYERDALNGVVFVLRTDNLELSNGVTEKGATNGQD